MVHKSLNPPAKPKVIRKDPDISKLETDLLERLGAVVHVKQKPKGKGSIEISYNSLGELKGIPAKTQ